MAGKAKKISKDQFLSMISISPRNRTVAEIILVDEDRTLANWKKLMTEKDIDFKINE